MKINEIIPKKESAGIRINSIKTGNVQWLYKGGSLVPISITTIILPAGVYGLKWDSDSQQPVPESKEVNTDELFILPIPVIKKVLTDVKSFWESKIKYIEYKSTYKRGILLYGLPGCGKSSVIAILIKELVEKYNGVVFIPQTEEHLQWMLRVIPTVKEIEPDKKIIVVLEDIDNFVGDTKSYSQMALLNFLDGASSSDGVVTIATTNYPELLQERITNRPSRFDRRYEVGKPNAEVRKFYIESKLKKEDIKNINIEEIVSKTEGFTIDHLKEYILSVFILGYSHDEAFEEVSEILGTKILKNTKITDLGFHSKKEKK